MEEIRIPLSELPDAQTTVTWGDSFAAMEATRDFGLAFVPKPYYGRLYRLEDIADLAARYGIPKPDPENYEGLPAADTPETFIEIQLWSDGPVRSYFLQRATQRPQGYRLAGSRRITMDFDVGVLLVSAVESRGTRTFASGKYAAAQPSGVG
jgi:hypothetical protein